MDEKWEKISSSKSSASGLAFPSVFASSIAYKSVTYKKSVYLNCKKIAEHLEIYF